MSNEPWIWRDGNFIPSSEANIHVLSHVVHYGSSVFEGIRTYGTDRGSILFHLPRHIARLFDSARVYRMEVPYSPDTIVEACKELVVRNGLGDGYVRPIILRGVGAFGVNPRLARIETFVMSWPWGQYLGDGALTLGIDACVSSWNRPAPNTHPSLAKAGGNYLNAQLMKMEAETNGYAEAIALSVDGTVSEASAQNIFLVKRGTLFTPPADGSMLSGITREVVIQLAQDLGIPLREERVPRETLYSADEVFLTGTASEITPVRSIDRIDIGTGGRGPVTERLQEALFSIARGTGADPHGWRTEVAFKPLKGVA